MPGPDPPPSPRKGFLAITGSDYAEVTLLFGIHVRDREIYAGSAEEDRGQTCFSVTAEVSEIDLEIADERRQESV